MYYYDIFTVFTEIDGVKEKDHNDIHDIVNNIIESYNEPRRQYHNIYHISEMLKAIKPTLTFNDYTINQNLRIAIVYHDIIYDILKSDNEIESAKRMMNEVGKYIKDNKRLQVIYDMILATDHKREVNIYSGLLCDIDLHQLACDRNNFLINESLIRKEYESIPDELFYPGRVEILQKFLNRRRIYYTYYCYNKYEMNARDNLKYIIDVYTNKGL